MTCAKSLEALETGVTLEAMLSREHFDMSDEQYVQKQGEAADQTVSTPGRLWRGHLGME